MTLESGDLVRVRDADGSERLYLVIDPDPSVMTLIADPDDDE